MTTAAGQGGAAPTPPRWARPPLGPHTLGILFIAANLIMIGLPLGRTLAGHGGSKDYPLWYKVGQAVLTGGDLYQAGASGRFGFLYPPFAAVLLAPFAVFGLAFSVLCVCLVNLVSWRAAIGLSDRLSAAPGPKAWWVMALPSVVALPLISDMFDLGQPNLMLLAIMLAGLALLQSGRQWSAGAMFAAAASLKAFPVAILPYLIWRRRWVSAASMVLFTLVFMFLVPAPFRGFERNLTEVKAWSEGMVLSASQQGFGQRPEQNWVVLGLAGLLGLGFVAALPAERRRTPASDAAEFALLIALMTIASPLARAYYFVWLLFPFTLLVYRAVLDPERRVRWAAGGGLAASLALFTLGAGAVKPHLLPALGSMFWATLVVIAALVWLMRRSAKPAG